MDHTDVEHERLRVAFRQVPVAVLVTVVNAVLAAVVLISVEPFGAVSTWLLFAAGVVIFRMGLWWAYRRASVTNRTLKRWSLLSVAGTAAAGLLWGIGAVLLFPASEVHQLFWTFLIGGMSAGAAALHFAHFPTAAAFILIACVPLGVRFALASSTYGISAGGMIGAFVVALLVTAFRASAHFGENLRLRLDLAGRTRELDAANAELRAEMAERAATEAHLRQAQKMEALGQLTGGIAHDFNNLLFVVLANLELLQRRIPTSDSKAASLLGTAVSSAERGAGLVRQLLTVGQRQVLEPELVDIVAIIREMSSLLNTSVGDRIRMTLDLPAFALPVEIDRNQLELALINLAVNARDAMPEGGDLTIAAREQAIARSNTALAFPPGDYVVVSVADNGEGMDEATLARATEPFFTTKAMGKGTGLGLAIVQGFAGQSGGYFRLVSRKGSGTTAELWFPKAAGVPKVARRQREVSPVVPRGQHRVLVVDDDPLVLESTISMLQDLGYSTAQAASGAEALDVLRSVRPIALVIADYAMPGLSGLQLAEKIRRDWPRVAVVVASGHAELPEKAPSYLRQLTKPFDKATLAALIETSIGSHPGPG